MTQLRILVAIFCVGCAYDLTSLGPDLDVMDDGGASDSSVPDDAQEDVPDAVVLADAGDAGAELPDAGQDAGSDAGIGSDAGCSTALDCPTTHACWMGECQLVENWCTSGTQCDSTICITSTGCTARCEDDSDCPSDGRYVYDCRIDFSFTFPVCVVDGPAS